MIFSVAVSVSNCWKPHHLCNLYTANAHILEQTRRQLAQFLGGHVLISSRLDRFLDCAAQQFKWPDNSTMKRRSGCIQVSHVILYRLKLDGNVVSETARNRVVQEVKPVATENVLA